MRHSKFLLLIAAFAYSSFAAAQIESCYESSKELYVDIQIYNETYKIDQAKAVVGPRLEFDLSLFDHSAMSVHEKVKSLETAFAKCDINLTSLEQNALDQSVMESKLRLTR